MTMTTTTTNFDAHFGKPPEPHELTFRLGELTGMLMRSELREQLTQRVREGKLKAAYVTLLRDQLTRVLQDSGIEA